MRLTLTGGRGSFLIEPGRVRAVVQHPDRPRKLSLTIYHRPVTTVRTAHVRLPGRGHRLRLVVFQRAVVASRY